MSHYEYKVVPAPRKAAKAKGVKGDEARFAHALAEVMNLHGTQGWDYHRADNLPCETRAGLFKTRIETTTRTVLVFRRWVETGEASYGLGQELRARDTAATPEQLAAELADQRREGAPSGAAKPRLGAAERLEPGASPQLGPARHDPEASVHRFPGPERD